MTTTFNVTLSDYEIICMNLNSRVYYIGEDPLSFGVAYDNKTFVVNHKLTSIQEPIAFQDEKEIDLPSFLKLNKASKVFTIDGASYDQIGTYRIGWKLGNAEFSESQVYCTVPVEVKYVPKFIGGTIDFQTLSCNFPWSLKIPTYTDMFMQSVNSTVDLGATKEFLHYDEISRNISAVDPDLLENYKGSYEVYIDLTDSNGFKKEITINLIVICLE